MTILRCTEAFAVMEGIVPRVVQHDDVVSSDDPIVKGHEGCFEPVEDHLNRQRRIRDGEAVETATAAPGEVRKATPVKASQRRPSRRTVAKKAAAKEDAKNKK